MTTKSTNPTKPKETTLDDVMSAVGGVSREVTQIRQDVSALSQRVTVLEQQPALKTRVVHQNQNGNGYIPPIQNTTHELVDPIKITPSGQQKDGNYHRGVCARIGITKTKMTGRWKINCYIRGSMGRPTSAYGDRTGDYANLIELFCEVWPEISDDHFSDDEFYTRDAEIKKRTGGKGFFEAKFRVEPFIVEWHESEPDGNGKTWAYVDDVYPCPPLYEED